MTTDKFTKDWDPDKFLRGIGLRIDGNTVLRVVDVLEGRLRISSYDLYRSGIRRDGTRRTPICGKGTVYKIKRLYEAGKLDPYIAYLRRNASVTNDQSIPVDKQPDRDVQQPMTNVRNHDLQGDTTSQADQTETDGQLLEGKKLTVEHSDDIQHIQTKTADTVKAGGRYSTEWEHYEKIKDAIIGLQHACADQRIALLDVIQGERVFLNDSKLQEALDEFIAVVEECTDLGIRVYHKVVTLTIGRTSKRMHKRYKRQ